MSGVYLAITDGSGTVDLSNNYWNYYPDSAPDYEEYITERSTFRFDNTTLATTRTTIQSIGRYFTQAREWNKKRTGPRVFLLFKWQSSDDAYRSELLGGQVYADPGALQSGQAGGGDSGSFLQFDIEWTRHNFWEDNTERTLPAHGFNIVAGTARIYNSYHITNVDNEPVGTAGAGTVYAGTLLNTPVEAYLYPPIVSYTWSGTAYAGTFVAGTGATSGGTVAGSGIASGTINYTNGIWGITFQSAPSGTFTADYRYGYGNYLDIAGTAVGGDLPTPVKMRIVNSNGLGREYIGATYGATVNYVNAFECESFDTNGTATASTTASGGTYSSFDAQEPNNYEYALLFNDLNDLAQNDYFIPLLRVDGTPASTGGTFSIYNIYYTPLLINSTNITWTGEQQRVIAEPSIAGTVYNNSIIKLDPITLFNGEYLYDEDRSGTFYSGYLLRLSRIGTAVSSVIKSDFIQMMPTRGGYCELYSGGWSAGTYTVDGITERVYESSTAAYSYRFSSSYGWVSVQPNQNNRIYLLSGGKVASGWDGSISSTKDIVVTYRPRKRAL